MWKSSSFSGRYEFSIVITEKHPSPTIRIYDNPVCIYNSVTNILSKITRCFGNIHTFRSNFLICTSQYSLCSICISECLTSFSFLKPSSSSLSKGLTCLPKSAYSKWKQCPCKIVLQRLSKTDIDSFIRRSDLIDRNSDQIVTPHFQSCRNSSQISLAHFSPCRSYPSDSCHYRR